MIFNNNSTRGHTGSLLVYYISALYLRNTSGGTGRHNSIRSLTK